MDIAHAGNLSKRQLLDVVEREQQAVGRWQSRKRLGNRLDKPREKPDTIWVDVDVFNGGIRTFEADAAGYTLIVELF